MRAHTTITTLLVTMVFLTAGAIQAQISDPIPTEITKQGLSVEIREVARLPDTRALHQAEGDALTLGWARVSFVRDLPDGRRFANDSRGLLYLLNGNNEPSLYANVAEVFSSSFYDSLQSFFTGLRRNSPKRLGYRLGSVLGFFY